VSFNLISIAETGGFAVQRSLLAFLTFTFVAVASNNAFGHCEVPCGIYADQRRFEQMLEDQTTIAKGIASIVELADKTDAKSKNQLVRWVTTKEAHATAIQHTVAQYFLTQRIKSSSENYAKQLAAAHSVMVAAMKTKQDANPATATALNKAILDLYRAYEGKQPKFGHVH
jgi:nickel superoxide dismutase